MSLSRSLISFYQRYRLAVVESREDGWEEDGEGAGEEGVGGGRMKGGEEGSETVACFIVITIYSGCGVMS